MTDFAKQGEKAIAHFGVLGMHWGQHLPGKIEKSHNAPKEKIVSEDHSRSRENLKKPVSSLSTSAIQDTNNRLQAERKLSELKQQTSTIAKGQKRIQVIVGIAGTLGSLYAVTQSPLGKKAIAAGTAIIKSNGTKSVAKHLAV